MGNFNRGGNRFGGDRGGNRFGRGGKPSFPRKEWGNKDGNFDRQMFKAICGECNKPCEIPFEPREGKIVFCNDCFSKSGTPNRSENRGGRFERRDFGNRAPARPRFENNGGGNGDVAKLIEGLGVKIDRLTKVIESLAPAKVQEKAPVKEVVVSEAPVKAPVSLKKEIASAISPKKIGKKKVSAKKSK